MRNSLSVTCVLGVVALAFHGCSSAIVASAPSPSPLSASWKDIGGALPPGFEPSGAVWQTRTERLLVVSDAGMIAEIDAEGGSLRTWDLAGDLEDICIADPASDKVYVAVEQPPAIVEYDLAARRTLRVIPVPGLAADRKEKKNKGLEALAFVADPSDPDGGVFWAGFQSDGTVHVLSLPLRSHSDPSVAREIRVFTPKPGHRDLAGLGWDPVAKKIWAVYDKDDLLVLLDKDGRVEGTWPLSGGGQEGVAAAPGRIFVADDTTHSVMRFDRARN